MFASIQSRQTFISVEYTQIIIRKRLLAAVCEYPALEDALKNSTVANVQGKVLLAVFCVDRYGQCG
jgi:hypothetical protein